MSQFVRLLCKDPQIMKILNCGSCDPQTNTEATKGVQSLTEIYREMFKNLLEN